MKKRNYGKYIREGKVEDMLELFSEHSYKIFKSWKTVKKEWKYTVQISVNGVIWATSGPTLEEALIRIISRLDNKNMKL